MHAMRRPIFRRVWNHLDGYPGPCPVIERVFGVLVLPWHMVRHTIKARRMFQRYRDIWTEPARPESWRYCAGVAWLWWRCWYWWDWTPTREEAAPCR
jgi:hypothetical protein